MALGDQGPIPLYVPHSYQFRSIPGQLDQHPGKAPVKRLRLTFGFTMHDLPCPHLLKDHRDSRGTVFKALLFLTEFTLKQPPHKLKNSWKISLSQ